MLDAGLLMIRLGDRTDVSRARRAKAVPLVRGLRPERYGGGLDGVRCMKPGALMAVLAGLMELVAIVKVHGPNGYWSTSNGYEYNLVLIAVSVGVAMTGAGAYSLDALL